MSNSVVDFLTKKIPLLKRTSKPKNQASVGLSTRGYDGNGGEAPYQVGNAECSHSAFTADSLQGPASAMSNSPPVTHSVTSPRPSISPSLENGQ